MPNNTHKPKAIKELSRNPYEAATALDEQLSAFTRRGTYKPTAMLADLYGMSETTVRHYIRVKRQCEPSILAKLKAGSLRFSHALALSALTHEQQLKAAPKTKEVPIPEFNRYCTQLKTGEATNTSTLTSKRELSPDMAFFMKFLSKSLGERVDVVFRDKSVVLESTFYTLERAAELLCELHTDRAKGKVVVSTTGMDQGQHVGTIRMVFKDEDALKKHLIPVGDRIQNARRAEWGKN
jgi:hypothetical protein